MKNKVQPRFALFKSALSAHFFTYKNKKHTAFTLAELLTAVLVISIIMVALAPVITKRMKDNVSVTTDNKKGLEIFANPGTYTFNVPIGINTLFLQGSGGGGGGGGASYIDKSVTYLSNSTWTVPKGVNKVTFTLYGAGGGGGGGYGKTGSESCPSPFVKFSNMADNGRDLCYFSKRQDSVVPYGGIGTNLQVIKLNEDVNRDSVCFRDEHMVGSIQHLAPGGQDPNTMILCSPAGARHYCECYLPIHLNWVPQCDSAYGTLPSSHIGRIISTTELKRIFDASPAPEYKYLQPQYLDFVGAKSKAYTNKISSVILSSQSCKYTGSTSNSCYTSIMFSGGGQIYWYNWNPYDPQEVPVYHLSRSAAAGRPVCVYEIRDWTPYGGGGGASGAKFVQTISVLPGDTLEITIGQGGSGGSAGSNGSTGGATKIVHKRGGTTKGTYYANGGIGGNRATSSGIGSQTTTPAACSSSSGCNQTVSTNSGKGYAGTETEGGKGAGEVSGGTPDSNPSNASNNTSFGGGGGFCPRGSKSPSSCQKGGKGGSGKVEISYSIMLPGSGGGSASRVGGVEESTNKDYEIKYKVSEGTRVVFEVGSGGSGGAPGQDGLNGTPTIIGDNEIVFLAGEGGKTVTQEQKDNLSNCIGTTTNSDTVISCVNNSSYKPQGGRSGIITVDNEIKTTTLGLLITNTNNTSYTVPSSTFKGKDGNMPSQINQNIIPWSYGYDGGVGGAPFGIRKSNAAASITCGGGMSGTYADTTDIENYVCTSGNINANNARNHDPANNEFGGSGGGGGGVTNDSFEQGQGGNGSSGYLRIRWDASEQE